MKSGGVENSGQILAETVKVGHVQIPVTVERSGGYVTFRATWYENGKRTRRGFADRSEAITFAKSKAQELLQNGGALITLLGLDRLTYQRACDTARKLGMPLDAICDEYAAARAILGGGSLLDACRAYSQSGTRPPAPRLVSWWKNSSITRKAWGYPQTTSPT